VFDLACDLLALVYATLSVIFAVVCAYPQLVRRWHSRLPSTLFSKVRIATLRSAWRDLFLSCAGLAYLFYGQEEFLWALGASALALLGAAAFRVGEDVHAARKE